MIISLQDVCGLLIVIELLALLFSCDHSLATAYSPLWQFQPVLALAQDPHDSHEILMYHNEVNRTEPMTITLDARDAKLALLALHRYWDSIRANGSQNTYQRIANLETAELIRYLETELRAISLDS